MEKLAYLDCPTGIAGDMCLGALVHGGVPLTYLEEQLSRLGLSQEYQLRSETVLRNYQQATKLHVDLTLGMVPQAGEPDPNLTFGHHGSSQPAAAHRHLGDIEQIILRAQLPPRVEAWSLDIFRHLATAEGAVHGIAPEQVHFHEVGATDAIVDIVGTCLGLDWLQIDTLYCSALPTGGGTVKADHGQIPVPTPAVLELLARRQVPVYHNGIDRELVTPTGAAIATTLARAFGPPPAMRLERIGLGAGSITLPLPNLVRLWLGEGETSPAKGDWPQGTLLETVIVLETQVDDCNPQAIGYVLEALLTAGALDVLTQPVGMKKSRPGLLLTVICAPETVATCETILFRETTTLGIRRSQQQRTILPRQLESVTTPYGPVRVKVAQWGHGAIANVQPEYEDCASLAQDHEIPWAEVHQMVLQIWYRQRQQG